MGGPYGSSQGMSQGLPPQGQPGGLQWPHGMGIGMPGFPGQQQPQQQPQPQPQMQQPAFAGIQPGQQPPNLVYMPGKRRFKWYQRVHVHVQFCQLRC